MTTKKVKEVTEQAKTQVAEAVSGFNAYVNTPVINSLNYPKLAGAVLGSYVVLEVMHHVVLGGYLMPYLTTSLGLGATAVSMMTYGALALTALGVSWLVYKMFFKTTAVKSVGSDTVFVPVESPATS